MSAQASEKSAARFFKFRTIKVYVAPHLEDKIKARAELHGRSVSCIMKDAFGVACGVWDREPVDQGGDKGLTPSGPSR